MRKPAKNVFLCLVVMLSLKSLVGWGISAVAD